MKKLLLFIFIGLLVLSGCSTDDLGKIKIINDEIDNSKVVILHVIYKSSDIGLPNYKALISYSKKIKENEAPQVTVNFKINTDFTESILGQKGYIVTGDQRHELTLANISAKTDSYTESHSSSFEKEVDVHTYTVYIMEGEVSLSPEITVQMKGSEKHIYRLYLGSRPLTFEVSKKDLQLVKTFIDSK